MHKLIHKLLFYSALIFYITLFSCSVHYEKEKIINNGQKYHYLISLNNMISPTYMLNKLNKNIAYNFLFILYLSDKDRDFEFKQFNNYIENIVQNLQQQGIKYQYKIIAQVQQDLTHYELDVYYTRVKN